MWALRGIQNEHTGTTIDNSSLLVSHASRITKLAKYSHSYLSRTSNYIVLEPKKQTMDTAIPSFIFIPSCNENPAQQQHLAPDSRNCYSDSRLNSSIKSIDASSAFTPDMDATRDDSTEMRRERWLSSPSSSRQPRATGLSLPPNLPRRLPERTSRKGPQKGTPIPLSFRMQRNTTPKISSVEYK